MCLFGTGLFPAPSSFCQNENNWTLKYLLSREEKSASLLTSYPSLTWKTDSLQVGKRREIKIQFLL